ncbi:hypothetical protein ACFLU4_08695 [Chloroflexota bacterium]
MGRKIKIYRWGEVTEVEPEEAQRIVKECAKQKYIIIVDTKSQRVIRKIGPDVEAITICSPMGGG